MSETQAFRWRTPSRRPGKLCRRSKVEGRSPKSEGRRSKVVLRPVFGRSSAEQSGLGGAVGLGRAATSRSEGATRRGRRPRTRPGRSESQRHITCGLRARPAELVEPSERCSNRIPRQGSRRLPVNDPLEGHRGRGDPGSTRIGQPDRSAQGHRPRNPCACLAKQLMVFLLWCVLRGSTFHGKRFLQLMLLLSPCLAFSRPRPPLAAGAVRPSPEDR